MIPGTTLQTARDATGRSVSAMADGVREPVAAVAFWLAIALPFLHLPLLFATGLETPTETTAFLTLLVANVLALVVGHSYGTE